MFYGGSFRTVPGLVAGLRRSGGDTRPEPGKTTRAESDTRRRSRTVERDSGTPVPPTRSGRLVFGDSAGLTLVREGGCVHSGDGGFCTESGSFRVLYGRSWKGSGYRRNKMSFGFSESCLVTLLSFPVFGDDHQGGRGVYTPTPSLGLLVPNVPPTPEGGVSQWAPSRPSRRRHHEECLWSRPEGVVSLVTCRHPTRAPRKTVSLYPPPAVRRRRRHRERRGRTMAGQEVRMRTESRKRHRRVGPSETPRCEGGTEEWCVTGLWV